MADRSYCSFTDLVNHRVLSVDATGNAKSYGKQVINGPVNMDDWGDHRPQNYFACFFYV
ncbi:hypothetical protein AHAS_Ahas20G0200700 [Arachis hypogaea]